MANEDRDRVFDPAAELLTLGIDTLRDGPEDRQRFAALVELMAHYSHDIWTDETHGYPFMREDVEEWFADVTNYATTRQREQDPDYEASNPYRVHPA